MLVTNLVPRAFGGRGEGGKESPGTGRSRD